MVFGNSQRGQSGCLTHIMQVLKPTCDAASVDFAAVQRQAQAEGKFGCGVDIGGSRARPLVAPGLRAPPLLLLFSCCLVPPFFRNHS